MYDSYTPWVLLVIFGLMALWSGWAVVAAIQGHRRRRRLRFAQPVGGARFL